jgi:DNA-binding MarR family transcriptional regulator
MNSPEIKYEDCIIFLLAKAYQKAHADFKKRLIPYGLTPIQHLILEALWIKNGVPAKEIGEKLVLDGATLSGVLDRLVSGDWITKEIDSDDKRIQRIYLTEKAKSLRPQLAEQRNRANTELMQKLSLEEKILLKRLLRDLQD